MADVHSKEQRSRNMAAIKGRDTKPEVTLRKLLWAKGLRYRLKNKLHGKPDLVFPAVRLAVFVDGCFWHRCPKHFQAPANNAAFWKKKISGNVKRDEMVKKLLVQEGWHLLRVWEHDVRKTPHRVADKIFKRVRALKN